MSRPVSFVPVTLALGVLALCGLTRSEAQTASPAAAAHRLTQRRAGLEERPRRLAGMAATGRYENGVSPADLPAEAHYIQRRPSAGDFRVGRRVLLAAH